MGENGQRVRDVNPREWMFEFGMIQVMQPEPYREDRKHCDGGASLVHMGFSLFGERYLRFWEKNGVRPHELQQKPGDVYITNPGAFEHQVVHRDVPPPGRPIPGLLDVFGMGFCKVAVQFRSSVFSKNRGTLPPATPMVAFKAASGVVARWLVHTAFAQPTVADCEEEEDK